MDRFTIRGAAVVRRTLLPVAYRAAERIVVLKVQNAQTLRLRSRPDTVQIHRVPSRVARTVDQDRVALFLPSLGYGGVERVMLHLAGGFSEMGFAIDVVAADASGEFRGKVPSAVRVVDLGATRVASSLPALVRYLRATKPTVLIAAMTHCGAAALLARSMAGTATRVIVTEHAPLANVIDASRRLRVHAMRWVVRWLYPRADAVVAVSRGVARDIEALMRCPAGTVHVIYNPVVTPELLERGRATVEEEWFRAGAPPVVLAVGRLEPEKDFETLLRAFAQLRERRPARILILGEGSHRAALEQLARELGIQADVRLPGFCPNPYPYMRAASVLALSSRWEGLGIVLVEALALGTPVVSTDCPSGPREILRGGEYGALVPVGDSRAMAQALEQALHQPRCVAAQDWVDMFTPQVACSEYAKLFRPS